jgi:hypothetical protein
VLGLHTAQFTIQAENIDSLIPDAFFTAGAMKIPTFFGVA